MITKRGQQLISRVNALCEETRENLSTVLSFLWAFGYQDATGVINDVIEDVASAQESHEGSRWRGNAKPDWVLLFFETHAIISGRTWQAVTNNNWKNGGKFSIYLYKTIIRCVLRFVFRLVAWPH